MRHANKGSSVVHLPIAMKLLEAKKNDGFILVAVLWLLGALSALVSIYAAYVIGTANSLAPYDNRLRAQALVSAAAELVAYDQSTSPAQLRPSFGRLSFRLGEAQISVAYHSESARIDLNKAPAQLLARLFTVLGTGPDLADAYAAAIIAWRTTPRAGQEDDALAYRKAGYLPRGAPFPSVRELALVLDIPGALVERALPYVTTFSGRAQINILTAEPKVLLAIPGMTQESVVALLKQRAVSPNDGKPLMQLTGAGQSFATLDPGRTFRLNVDIVFDRGGSAKYDVVIQLFEEADEPLAILTWRDIIDEPAEGAQ